MSDTSLEPVESDLPVNPYSLLEAVNSASNISRSGWVLYLALMAYLMVAVAGVTHKDLLLNAPIKLPIMEVNIDLARFFAFAPLVLLFTHFGMLMQHVMLARKVIAFDESLQPLENTSKPNHPLRLELHSYFFTQALAGPQRSWLFGFFLQAMIWLSLVVLPVFLILYIQLSFLPYHDEGVTWGHRIVLLIDVALLFFIGVFLRRADASFFHALYRLARYYPISFVVTAVIFVAVIMFSFFIATVPYGFMDRAGRTLPMVGAKPSETSDVEQQRYFGYAMPFLYGSTLGNRNAIFGLFHRNLIAKDLDLVSDKDVASGEASIILRGRNLRDANLNRSDLHQADLTGADLRNAKLKKTDLSGAQLTCTDIDLLTVKNNREAAECTQLTGAQMVGVKLRGAQLQGSDFSYTNLERADLSKAKANYAIFTGANLFDATLKNIEMKLQVNLNGAILLAADMQGAQFTGAWMLGADLSGASLQGAIFDYAHLQGVDFLAAELQGASLNSAILYGADLSDTNLTGVDLSKARIWQTNPPSSSGTKLSYLADIKLSTPRDSEIEDLGNHVKAITNPTLKGEVLATLEKLLDQGQRDSWGTGDEITQWRTLAASPAQAATGIDDIGSFSPYSQRLTNYLGKLMCISLRDDAAIAGGIVSRAKNGTFKGNAQAIYDTLNSSACPGADAMDKEDIQDLANKVRSVE